MTTQTIVIDNIHILQSDVRSLEEVHRFIDILSRGEEIGKVDLRAFPNGRIYVHDGHHRLVAKALIGMHLLQPEEYDLTDFQYYMYNCTNFSNGWITPLNIKSEYRYPDLSQWKRKINGFMHDPNFSTDDIERYIHAHKHEYCKKRNMDLICELTESVKTRM